MADAGRVIAGTARGIRLAAPGSGTRPLADRVKETAFAILDPDLAGSRFLDLFAGSGAAGIEALSRGAAHATFVERDKAAVAVIATNLERAHLAGPAARVVRADALAWLRDHDRGTGAAGTRDRGAARRPTTTASPPGGGYDVVFIDPPYADTDALVAALDAVGPHLAGRARVVAKHFWRDAPPERVGLLASERSRRFGETALTFYRRIDDEQAATMEDG